MLVTDEGRPAALVLRLTDDELEEHLPAANADLQAELEQAYAECLADAGRPVADRLTEEPTELPRPTQRASFTGRECPVSWGTGQPDRATRLGEPPRLLGAVVVVSRRIDTILTE